MGRIRVAPIVALVLLVSMLGSVSDEAVADLGTGVPAGDEGSCTPMERSGEYGLMADGTVTTADAPGSALVSEFANPYGGVLSSIAYPEGFNPTSASDATLRRFHLPERPSNPGALADWLSLYGHPLTSERTDRPPCATNLAAAFSTNWSGRVSVGTGIRDVNGRWTQPNLQTHCSHASMRAIWNGIGLSSLIQAGSITVDTSGSNINAVSAFVEVYPKEPVIQVAAPAILTGDTINLRTNYATSNGGTATWTFTNQTTGVTNGWFEAGVAAYYDGIRADWIDERPSNFASGAPYLLRRSSNVTYWAGERIDGVQAGSFSAYNVTMKDVDTLMTAQLGQTTTSSETWLDCGPGSGTTL